MSSELKTAAQQAVDAFDAFGDADDFASLFELTQKMRALRTAIQQAEAKTDKPAAVRNPFAARCYTMSESHLSGYRLLVGFEKLEDAQAAHEWIARYGRCDYLHLGVEASSDA